MFTFQDPSMTGSPTTGDVITGAQMVNFKYSIYFKKPISVRFNATNGGTVADIVDNSFHVLATCTSTALGPNLYYNCRVCYKDK